MRQFLHLVNQHTSGELIHVGLIVAKMTNKNHACAKVHIERYQIRNN